MALPPVCVVRLIRHHRPDGKGGPFFQGQLIEEIPKSINLAKYLEIEKKLLEFSLNLDIDPQHLDFVLWYKEAGEVFK